MKNEIVRCKCVDMSVDGQGIGRTDAGLVLFVKGLIKGETADVKIIAEKKNYAYGIIDKLIEVSPHRIESLCPIAYKCGGCDLRHIAYDYQLVLKKELLMNTFKGYQVNDVIPADNPDHYRNKVQVPFRDQKMGFYRRYSNDIVEFSQCFLQSERANAILNFLKPLLIEYGLDTYIRHILIKDGVSTDQVMVAFIVRDLRADFKEVTAELVAAFPEIRSVLLNLNDRDTNVILGEEVKILYGNEYIEDEYDGLRVRIGLKSFYQVNHEQMLKLYRKIYELSGVSENDRVLDLYCGIGTISLYMARYAGRVRGVEIVAEAIANAKINAGLNGLNNTEFILADASKGMDEYLKDTDLLIVDPPRKGLSKELIDSIISNNVQKMVYVSCNPATLNRDLELLKQHYSISAINPVDMFPNTVHVETVVYLSKLKSDEHVKVEVDMSEFEPTGSETVTLFCL